MNFVSVHEEEYSDFYNRQFKGCRISDDDLLIIDGQLTSNLVYWIWLRDDIDGIIDSQGNYIKLVRKETYLNSIMSYFSEQNINSYTLNISINGVEIIKEIQIDRNDPLAEITKIEFKNNKLLEQSMIYFPKINETLLLNIMDKGVNIYADKKLYNYTHNKPHHMLFRFGYRDNVYPNVFGDCIKDEYWLTKYYRPLGNLIQEEEVTHYFLFKIKDDYTDKSHLEILINTAIINGLDFDSYLFEDNNFVMIFKPDVKNKIHSIHFYKRDGDIYYGFYEITSRILIIPKSYWQHTAGYYMDVLNLYINYNGGDNTKLRQWAKRKWNVECDDNKIYQNVVKVINNKLFIGQTLQNNGLKYRL